MEAIELKETVKVGVVLQGEADETDDEEEQVNISDETRHIPVNAVSPEVAEVPSKPIDEKLNSFVQWKLKDVNISLRRQTTQKRNEFFVDVSTKMDKVLKMLDGCHTHAVSTSEHMREAMGNLQKATKRMEELYSFADESLPKFK